MGRLAGAQHSAERWIQLIITRIELDRRW